MGIDTAAFDQMREFVVREIPGFIKSLMQSCEKEGLPQEVTNAITANAIRSLSARILIPFEDEFIPGFAEFDDEDF